MSLAFSEQQVARERWSAIKPGLDQSVEATVAENMVRSKSAFCAEHGWCALKVRVTRKCQRQWHTKERTAVYFT
ncbi:MAG: hypothetical protein ACYC4B_14480, partial [Pirellulaceae bacterium]